MLSNAFSLLATALAASTLVSGQTFTDCNPTQKGMCLLSIQSPLTITNKANRLPS